MLIIPISGNKNNDRLTLLSASPNHLFMTGHVWSFNQSETRKSRQDV